MYRVKSTTWTGAPVLPALIALLAFGAEGDNVTGQAGTQFPEGVTQEKIDHGKMLFSGDAGCHVCHGRTAQGVSNFTSDLTDGEWLYTPGGTLEAIKAVIADGLTAQQTGGLTMPPMGRKDLTEVQIEALGAYLWSVNQKDG